jgi:predicted house-cleaning noncanonical NTP pyrophosphatase (MazG superfamily)
MASSIADTVLAGAAQGEEWPVGKLVRDRIPEIIEADGRVPMRRTLTEDEYGDALLAKLQEEASELAGAAPADRLEEAADVYEVLLALVAHTGHSLEDLTRAADRKRTERGGFLGRVWLESW